MPKRKVTLYRSVGAISRRLHLRRRSGRNNSRQIAVSIITSLFVHAIAFLLLSLCIVLIGHGSDRIPGEIETRIKGGGSIEIETDLEFDEPDLAMNSPVMAKLPNLELPSIEVEQRVPDPATGTDSHSERSLPQPSQVESAVSSATEVEDAIDSILGDIRGRLRASDLLVVWLVDGSRSLVDDRRRVAARLEPFLQQFAGPGSQQDSNLLRSAVVSFGATARERVSPTEFGDQVVGALEKLPVDASGKENILGAIEKCITMYRGQSGQILIVVWTDESGDDVETLEQTIRRCRSAGVSVSVVGPSAVLGSEIGFHAYEDPKTQLVYHLPVTRGPDTAVLERIQIPYWFRARLPRWSPEVGRQQRDRGRSLPSWYGGNDLAGLASGFGPFALTRLALQTGGSYTILDRHEDRGPFQIDQMRQYTPKYCSASEYRKLVENHPLRRAVYAAVRMTLSKRELRPPAKMFFGERSEVPPYRFQKFYFTPAQFRSKLSRELRTTKRKAKRGQELLERALLLVSKEGDPERGLDDDYEQERSHRWKAWYDLTRGRLLAMTARLEEYILTCDEVLQSGYLDSTTNFITILPSPDTKAGRLHEQRVAEATRLLTRCLSEHPNTPWAYLAQRELDYSSGLSVRQAALRLSGPRSTTTRPNLPRL